MEEKINIVKVRDNEPLYLKTVEDRVSFIIENQENNKISKNDLRSQIEPWLTSLFQSEHMSVLLGSGLSKAIVNFNDEDINLSVKTESNNNCGDKSDMSDGGNVASQESEADTTTTTLMEQGYGFELYKKEINDAAKASAEKTGRNEKNLEDIIRVANELLRGLEILGKEDEVSKLRSNVNSILESLISGIINDEKNILNKKDNNSSLNYLGSFLMSFATRSGARDRLNIFTTNYDRVIEYGADHVGLRLIDRFVGTLSPVFRSSRLDVDMHYNPPGVKGEPRYLEGVARFTKLHGSLDWVDINGEIRRIGVPFGSDDIEKYITSNENEKYEKLLIYPNSTKDRETAEYPYVELFRDFAAALCRPNSTIVTYGYSFGDEHINRVIKDMLTIPSTHLVIISYDDSTGRLMKFYYRSPYKSQISLIIGENVAEIGELVKYYLPRPSIDMAMTRMAQNISKKTIGEDKENIINEVSKETVNNGFSS